MRTKIEVGNLTQGQFDWLKENIPGYRRIPQGTPRMCVVFVGPGKELDGHVELPPREFVTVIERLAQITRAAETLAEASGYGIDGDQGPAVGCSPDCEAQDDDRPHLLSCPVRKIGADK